MNDEKNDGVVSPEDVRRMLNDADDMVIEATRRLERLGVSLPVGLRRLAERIKRSRAYRLRWN